MYKNIIIFKNDAVGDLVQSIPAIYNLINNKNISNIKIYLSERSKSFSFFFNNKKTKIEILNYDLTFLEKVKIFFSLFKKDIDEIYILSPKNFYYYLPLIFKRIKFIAICINNYKKSRPIKFLRKFLFKYEINDREAKYKRISTVDLQKKLCFNSNNNNQKLLFNVSPSKQLIQTLPENYIYFHIKQKILNEMNWDLKKIKILLNTFLEFSDNVVITRDIEFKNKNDILKKEFSYYNFRNNEKLIKNKIFLFDYIEGEDLYFLIKKAKITIAFHGMMTNLASIEKKRVIDLWQLKINSYEDYHGYRNAFYEFKPKYKDYNFIVPNKDIFKTIKKIKNILTNKL